MQGPVTSTRSGVGKRCYNTNSVATNYPVSTAHLWHVQVASDTANPLHFHRFEQYLWELQRNTLYVVIVFGLMFGSLCVLCGRNNMYVKCLKTTRVCSSTVLNNT